MDPRETQLDRGCETPRDVARRYRSDRSPEQIRRDIDEARERIDCTVDELQVRLSPRYIMNQAVETMKDKGRQAQHSLTETLRQHPIPTTVAALGLGWLIATAIRDRFSGSGHSTREDAELRRRAALSQAGYIRNAGAYPGPSGFEEDEERGDGRSRAAQIRASASAAGHAARERARRWASSARHQASDLTHEARVRASEMGHDIARRASSLASGARRQASYAAEQARHGAAQARETAVETYESHPLAVGVAALGAGIAIGLALPSTRKEDEWFGETRDDLVNQARCYGREALDRGEEVAEAAYEGAKSEARRQNLTPAQMKDEAKEAGREIKERTREVARAATESAKAEAKDSMKRSGDGQDGTPQARPAPSQTPSQRSGA